MRDRYGAGSWVVVTGATNPLGKEFVSHFNSKGFNLILLDSDAEQLSALR